MKIVKFCLLPLLVLVTLPFIVGFFCPETWEIEVSEEFAATPEAIHPWVDELARWPEWVAMGDDSQTFEFSFEGEERGVGAIAISSSGNTNVRWEITASDPQKGVWFDESLQGAVSAKGAIMYEAQGATTRVTWVDKGSLGDSPIHKLFNLFMEKSLSATFQNNLANLKGKVEGSL